MNFALLVSTLTPEEQKEISAYINFSRKISTQGYRPVIASSKGKVAKFLTSDDDSLVDFVEELLKPDMLALINSGDLLLKAKLRGIKGRNEMLNDQGEPWKTVDVAEYLGISVQAVSKKRSLRKILGLSLGGRGYVFPSWQFQDHGILPGLSEILSILEAGLVPDWDKLRFFISTDFRLKGKTPLSYLKSANLEPVKLAAKAYGVQSAA
ncbi:MAG: hypothetical protein ACRC1Z_10295 [Waterburya sp.]